MNFGSLLNFEDNRPGNCEDSVSSVHFYFYHTKLLKVLICKAGIWLGLRSLKIDDFSRLCMPNCQHRKKIRLWERISRGQVQLEFSQRETKFKIFLNGAFIGVLLEIVMNNLVLTAPMLLV